MKFYRCTLRWTTREFDENMQHSLVFENRSTDKLKLDVVKFVNDYLKHSDGSPTIHDPYIINYEIVTPMCVDLRVNRCNVLNPNYYEFEILEVKK